MSSNGEHLKRGDGETPSDSTVESQTSDTSIASGTTGSWCQLGSDTMKRAAAKKLIERYFYQLVDGCGDPNCSNEYCASSGKVKNLTPNQAAAQAFQLFSQEAKLCESHPSKVPRTQDKNDTAGGATGPIESGAVGGAGQDQMQDPCNDPAPSNSSVQSTTSASHSFTGTVPKDKPLPFLTEEKLVDIIESCTSEDSYPQLIRALGEVYSSPESLSRSFLRSHPESPIDAMFEKADGKDLKNLKKEDVRTLEGDLDKDEDSRELELEKSKLSESTQSQSKLLRGNKAEDTKVDVPSLRRAYARLFKLPTKIFEGALVNAIVTLTDNLEIQLKLLGSSTRHRTEEEDIINIFVIITEIPTVGSWEFVDVAMPHMCKAAAHLSVACQARLARVWARHCKTRLKGLLESLQQLITLKVMTGMFTRDYCIEDDESITGPVKVIKIVYYANMLAGELDSPKLRQEEPAPPADDSLLGGGANKTLRSPPPVDPLESALQMSVLDSRQPLIPFHEFYNDPLSDAVEMDKDFAYYKSDPVSGDHTKSKKFSFMNYSFILTPATKTLGLYYDNRIRMYSERRMSFFQTAVGQPTNPYLKLKVRRDHIIDDALVELEMVAMENPKDLKKQLVVEFEGEQGIDEGGVSKEFFQLIVEEIFNPDYGMFVYQQETETVWFNPTSFESDAQFTLIGVVLGLAIYNNIILDVRFPMVVYKKLMGKSGTFHDLHDWNPTLYSGLKSLLDYEGEDIEDAFMQTFRVCYTDVFGSTLFHELKEGGDQMLVNQDNKQEFVDLYADFLVNKCVEKQFRAFRRGFQMVTDESPISLLFRPEEVELLVCGSKNLDFNELEEATEYDGGYTSETPIIRQFWELVHAMSLEDKRKLLQFTTGSDRVPVGGLSRLKMIIAKNGPDSDRLPTAHTCFNVLLLPEYCSREKLQERLVKAINYSKGFGML